MSDYLRDFQLAFLLALVVTWAIEIPLLALVMHLRQKGIGVRRVLGAGIVCSAATLPYLWFVLPHFVSGEENFYIGETLVTLAEAGMLRLILGADLRNALLASVVCNAASAVCGPWVIRAFSGQ